MVRLEVLHYLYITEYVYTGCLFYFGNLRRSDSLCGFAHTRGSIQSLPYLVFISFLVQHLAFASRTCCCVSVNNVVPAAHLSSPLQQLTVSSLSLKGIVLAWEAAPRRVPTTWRGMKETKVKNNLTIGFSLLLSSSSLLLRLDIKNVECEIGSRPIELSWLCAACRSLWPVQRDRERENRSSLSHLHQSLSFKILYRDFSKFYLHRWQNRNLSYLIGHSVLSIPLWNTV